MKKPMSLLGFHRPQCFLKIWRGKEYVVSGFFHPPYSYLFMFWSISYILPNQKRIKPQEAISLLCFRETCLIVCVAWQPVLEVIYMISHPLNRKCCELVILGISFVTHGFCHKITGKKKIDEKITFLFMNQLCMEKKFCFFILGIQYLSLARLCVK